MAKKATSARSGPAEFSAATRIVLLAGNEPFLRGEHTARLKAALKAAHGEVEVVQYDGASADAAAVLDDCRSYSLMQQHRLVVVDQAEALVKEATRPLFERYAAAPSEGSTLLLRADRWYPGKLDAAIAKVGVVIKCEPKPIDEVRAWVGKAAPARHGAPIDADAVDALLERLGVDLARLDAELEKLAVAAGPGGRITAELVESLVGGVPERSAFSIKDSLLERDPSAAARRVREILEGGSRDLAVPLVWAAMDAARQLHAASIGLRRGMNPFAIGKAAGIWPDGYRERVLARARTLGPDTARALLAATVDADRRQKSGFTEGERAATMLAVRFTTA